MQRRLCVAILSLEAIVLGLSTLVLLPLVDVSTATALGIGLGLMVACIVLSGLMRFRWALALGWLVQLAAIALGTVISAMYVLGVVFLVLWATAYFLGEKIERERAEWVARDAREREAAGDAAATAD
ncbi:MAG: DUF4233 domain-containing protein [Marmoricola sp.]